MRIRPDRLAITRNLRAQTEEARSGGTAGALKRIRELARHFARKLTSPLEREPSPSLWSRAPVRYRTQTSRPTGEPALAY